MAAQTGQGKKRRSSSRSTNEQPSGFARWKIDIENFGRITSGSIAMAPLVVLVGKNNTGKSYAASLIWALLNSKEVLFRRSSMPQVRVPAWFTDMLTGIDNENSNLTRELNQADFDDVSVYVKSHLLQGDGRRLSHLFSVSKMNLPNLNIKFDAGSYKKSRITLFRNEGSVLTLNKEIKDDVTIFELGIGKEFNGTNIINYANSFFRLIVSDFLSGREFLGAITDVHYIPAARTGLMLAYRPLVSTLLDTLGVEAPQHAQGSLPLPTIRFLQALTRKDAAEPSRWLTSIARDLEREVLGGKIVASRAQVPDFSYHPENMDESLPLHVASSMITELAPFLLLLRSGQAANGLVFEEPEAHLHLQAQRKIAVAIARLVNGGVPVVITTHSDTFIQQINNLMHIKQHRNKNQLMKELGYTERDLIDPALARAYEFVEGERGTSIVELRKVKEGFIVPTLNETLSDLATETFTLQD